MVTSSTLERWLHRQKQGAIQAPLLKSLCLSTLKNFQSPLDFNPNPYYTLLLYGFGLFYVEGAMLWNQAERFWTIFTYAVTG